MPLSWITSLAEIPPDLLLDDATLKRRRRGRNIAMLIVLVGLSVLFYAIAMVKMAAHGVSPL